MTINDPRVATCTMTLPRAPEEYEGQLTDGRWFYFRYRWGHASLGIGRDVDEAVDRSDDFTVCEGGENAGQWPDEATRDAVFTRLLDAALADKVIPSMLGDQILEMDPQRRGERLKELSMKTGQGFYDLARELRQLRKRAGMGA